MRLCYAVQEDVWEHVAPLIRSCADGYNACIFAYGQTGSGTALAKAPVCTRVDMPALSAHM